MNTEYFYDESDVSMFPPKPKPLEKPKGMITISLNFVFYILLFFLVFNGNIKLLAAVLMVIFIHEFGHFVMMKKYGYSDKKMFFIPFLNLFFTEEDSSQVTIREKLFILFAGPLPGIIIGFAALIYGSKVANEQLVGLAWIFLVWNLINLVPLDMLDGGVISETLYSRKNYFIQLVTTIVVIAVILLFVVLSKSYFTLIIPMFLILKMNGMKKLNEMRNKLEEKGLDLTLNFESLNNKQYWLIRKELLTINKLPGKTDIDDDYSESIYEGLIMQNMRAVLLNVPYNDVGSRGKLLFTFFWIILFVVPLTLLLTGPWLFKQ